MNARRPIAFLSYVRSDDDHDDGRITGFRKRLEGEVRMQSGQSFEIFQDRNDISWGQNWEERINTSLSDVSFLIPVITPSFFKSPACRTEFLTFVRKENTLGLNRLILPLYYVSCDELGDVIKSGRDDVVDAIRARNWTDWRPYRFKSFADEGAATALADLASMIKVTMRELEAIGAAAIRNAKSSGSHSVGLLQLPPILSEEQISEAARPGVTPSDLERRISTETETGKQSETLLRPVGTSVATDYRAFTKKFDEVIEASALAGASELLKLQKYLNTFSSAFSKIYEPSLRNLLSRFSPRERVPPMAISILVDNSGSMRGTKITHVAAWCLLIGEWLDRLGIQSEILGFTTRAWKGGMSREMWLTAGKPSNPGRLNDLRHLIYRPFSMAMTSAAPNIAAMVREGLLKENIDGEAVEWAVSRLEKQAAQNKILFVVSDGAPVDDSTLSVNPKNYLERHLRRVVDELPKNIKLYSIGVECDVSGHYPNAIPLKEASELGPRFFEALVNDDAFQKCFASSATKKRYRFARDGGGDD